MKLKKIIINTSIVTGIVLLTLSINNYYNKHVVTDSPTHIDRTEEMVPAETPLGYVPTAPVASTPSTKVIEVSKDDYPTETKYFEALGQSFIIKPDNRYLVEKFKFRSSISSIQTFLSQPDSNVCKDDFCDRKSIYTESKFTLEAIVLPNGNEAIERESSNDGHTCEKNVYFYYYKAKFDDGYIGYILVANFSSASSPWQAVSTNMPSRLQIYPVTPDETWKKSKKFYDKSFKKDGIREGYTFDEVLKSQWGKPYSKTRSNIGDMQVDIWTYSGGMLEFQNGYVARITTMQ